MFAQTKLLAAIPLFLVAGMAQSAIYKCTGNDGKISLQQVPCPESTAETKVAVSSGGWELVDSPKDGTRRTEVYLDLNSIRTEGANRRARVRVDMFDDSPNAKSKRTQVDTDYLVDCAAKKLKVLRITEKIPGDKTTQGPDTWAPFPARQSTRPTVFEKVCEASPRD